MYEVHPGQRGRTLIEEEQARGHAVQKWFSVMQKKKKKKKYKDDDEDEDDDDDTYHPSQDYNDDSQVDPEFRPTKREFKEADREGDS